MSKPDYYKPTQPDTALKGLIDFIIKEMPS